MPPPIDPAVIARAPTVTAELDATQTEGAPDAAIPASEPNAKIPPAPARGVPPPGGPDPARAPAAPAGAPAASATPAIETPAIESTSITLAPPFADAPELRQAPIWTLPRTPNRWRITTAPAAGAPTVRLLDGEGLPWPSTVAVLAENGARTTTTLVPSEPLPVGRRVSLAVTTVDGTWIVPITVEVGLDRAPWQAPPKTAPKKKRRR
jgi:hypothetical protein